MSRNDPASLRGSALCNALTYYPTEIAVQALDMTRISKAQRSFGPAYIYALGSPSGLMPT
jgi:hypothetical protein